MEDLSLHILDIADNSLRAGAENVAIRLVEHRREQTLTLTIEDDGIGMDDDMLKNATNPFFTTKEGKKFGIGLSLLRQAAEDTGGTLRVEAREPCGIKISVRFHTAHVDMKPMGNIAKTVRLLRATHPEVNFSFEHIVQE